MATARYERKFPELSVLTLVVNIEEHDLRGDIQYPESHDCTLHLTVLNHNWGQAERVHNDDCVRCSSGVLSPTVVRDALMLRNIQQYIGHTIDHQASFLADDTQTIYVLENNLITPEGYVRVYPAKED